MIEIFKTNVTEPDEAAALATEISGLLKAERVSFDLDDHERVLRVQSSASFSPSLVIMALNARGYWADILPDDVPHVSSPTLM